MKVSESVTDSENKHLSSKKKLRYIDYLACQLTIKYVASWCCGCHYCTTSLDKA